MIEHAAQPFRASPSCLCRLERHKFEPQRTHYFLSVQFTLYVLFELARKKASLHINLFFSYIKSLFWAVHRNNYQIWKQ